MQMREGVEPERAPTRGGYGLEVDLVGERVGEDGARRRRRGRMRVSKGYIVVLLRLLHSMHTTLNHDILLALISRIRGSLGRRRDAGTRAGRLDVQKLRHVLGRHAMTRRLHRGLLLLQLVLPHSRRVHIPSYLHHPHDPHTPLPVVLVCDLSLLPSIPIARSGNAEHRSGDVGLLETLREADQGADASRDIAEQGTSESRATDALRPLPGANRLERGRVGLGRGCDDRYSKSVLKGKWTVREVDRDQMALVAGTAPLLEPITPLNRQWWGYDGRAKPRSPARWGSGRRYGCRD